MILNSNNDDFSSLDLGHTVESKVARVLVFRSQRGHQLNALENWWFMGKMWEMDGTYRDLWKRYGKYGDLWKNKGNMGIYGKYHVVNIQKTMEHHHFIISMAIFQLANCQRLPKSRCFLSTTVMAKAMSYTFFLMVLSML